MITESIEDDALALDPDFAHRFEGQRRPVAQLYLISPLDVSGGFGEKLQRALDGGPVAAFQFRVKGVDQHEAARLADPLLRICNDRDIAFIVNDDVGLAKRIAADGVHLGQDDGDPVDARRLLGPAAQIGVTCHNSRHLAMAAGEAAADYVAFGAFFPSTTKPVQHVADPALLGWWSTVSEIPCVAIGGITAQNCAPLVRAGADFLAVSQGVWGHEGGAAAGVAAINAAIADVAGKPAA